MRILALNGGSSTVKAAIAEISGGPIHIVLRRTFERQDDSGPEPLFAKSIDAVAADAGHIDAVGHRVVHGGLRYRAAARIDDVVERAIESLVPLAPLHNPVALAGIRVARARLGHMPMVAVFDTSFHQERPPAARRYALPDGLTEEFGLWRYGFHGIAHSSLVDGAAAIEGTTRDRVTAVTLQLGRGCSACAVREGKSIETSMGFTPLEGLIMGTRSGDVDPGLVLHLLRHGRTVDEVEDLLENRAGLLGVGRSADMRELLSSEARGDPRATLAIEMFVRRIVATVGAYFTLLAGEGALVFGGGIGENSAPIRGRICDGLRAWNIRLDRDRNRDGAIGRISESDARRVYVVRTDEESMIAADVARVLAPV